MRSSPVSIIIHGEANNALLSAIQQGVAFTVPAAIREGITYTNGAPMPVETPEDEA